MNTTYRSKKQVTSLMATCTQGLAILMGMLRSCLGGALEEARRSLGDTYSDEITAHSLTRFLRPFSSKRAELERRLVPDEITARPSRDYGSSLTRLRLVVLVLLMMTV